ncbi:hypothetical protein [Effusibacillus dendaii]|uniref:Uncharacterized protein n=1 Tax=Effusibacillus dendaii TaxID=2743772 RepID=A0A7I8D960_9BACL|nr:hypothetical protein [Effusibacillus dendaii]BCJ86615.1 hypothetical protein skT53_16000 [Effusibacillus dendaii]
MMLALTGLIIDTGVLAYRYSMLCGAVDAAAWAALDSYDREIWKAKRKVQLNPEEAAWLARQYLQKNMPGAALTNIQVVDNRQVSVTGKYESPTLFMKSFGVRSVRLQAGAAAKLTESQ